MTKRTLERELGRLLRGSLEQLGFVERSALSYMRERDERIEILNFGGRLDGNEFKFTFSVGIRYPAIEALLRPDNDDSTDPTVSTPIHLLHPDRKYHEFTLSEDPGQVVDRVVEEIKNYALPFFERFTFLKGVEEELASGKASPSICFTPLQTTSVLAAIAVIDGRPEDAATVIAKALEDPSNFSPGKRRRIEDLRMQVLPR